MPPSTAVGSGVELGVEPELVDLRSLVLDSLSVASVEAIVAMVVGVELLLPPGATP